MKKPSQSVHPNQTAKTSAKENMLKIIQEKQRHVKYKGVMDNLSSETT